MSKSPRDLRTRRGNRTSYKVFHYIPCPQCNVAAKINWPKDGRVHASLVLYYEERGYILDPLDPSTAAALEFGRQTNCMLKMKCIGCSHPLWPTYYRWLKAEMATMSSYRLDDLEKLVRWKVEAKERVDAIMAKIAQGHVWPDMHKELERAERVYF